MDLWVRGNYGLIKPNNLIVEEYCGNYRIFTRLTDHNTITLGEYETKERALEVLDEIQDKVHTFCGFECANYKVINVVYEMPKE